MANAFTFDSVDVGDGIGGTYNLLVEDSPLDLGAEADLDIRSVPAVQVVIQGTTHKPTVNVLNCVVEGSTAADLRLKITALNRLTNARLGDKQLDIDAEPDRYFVGRFTQKIAPPPLGQLTLQFKMKFVSERAYNVTLTNDTEAIATDPDTVTIDDPGGSDDSGMVWYLRNSTGGAVTSITLNNTTTGETLTWTGSLGDDRWLAICSEENASPAFVRKHIYRSTAGGADPTVLSYTSVISGRANGSTFPKLKSGETNSVTVTGISTGTLQVIGRGRFI